MDTQGQTWSPDQAYSTGSFGFIGAAASYAASASALGTADPSLYATLRQAPLLTFKADLPNGNYRLVLHFAEWVASAPGQRLLKVSAEGVDLASNLDVYQQTGAGRAYTLPATVTVADGSLDLSVQGLSGRAMLAAVEVYGLNAIGVPTPTPTPTESPLQLELTLPSNAKLLGTP